MQSVVRDILPNARTGSCLRSVRQGSTCVPIRLSKGSNRTSYRNLQVCSSVWRCPVCAAKISEQRRRELLQLIDAHKAAGGHIYLLTLTFPHSERDSLADLLARLKKAENSFKSGRAWTVIEKDFGLLGTARAVECTFGKNGWHPHAHHLVFTKGAINVEAFKQATYAKWFTSCTNSGLGAPTYEHGIDVRDGTKAAAYVAKFGLEAGTPSTKIKEWGLENELTKWHLKKGRGSSLTPFDLLRIVLQADPATEGKIISRSKAKFREYAEAFHGKRQLVISPKLKKLYPIEEKSDEQAALRIDKDEVDVAVLTLEGWRAVLKLNIRGQMLEVARLNDTAILQRYLTDRWTEKTPLFLQRGGEEPGTAPPAAITSPVLRSKK